jgi:hypothetical protein
MEQKLKAKVQIFNDNQSSEDELKAKIRPDLQTTQREKRGAQPSCKN